MRVVVIGARGQLGAAMVHECAGRHDVVAFDRRSLDITEPRAVASALVQTRPDVIINCTGYNAVDAAEDHPLEALQVNALAVRYLARAATDTGAALVHFSSDFVFDGSASRPQTEEDQPNPRSVYAASKLLGEWFADAPHAYVLRVESLFGVVRGAAPKGSVAGIVQTLKAGGVPRVLEDRTVSPTYVFDAARTTLEMIERRSLPGLYHCVNSGHCTWLELATEAARLLNVSARFDIVRHADLKLRAARPLYCALSNRKLASIGITMPNWQDALARYIYGTV
jgi:dTDP-4-dehydrorhamnose reductase